MAYHFDENAGYSFDFSTHEWRSFPVDPPEPLGNRFYTLPTNSGCLLLGGHREMTLNRVFSFEESIGFRYLKPMMSCRADLCATFSSNSVFVIGGYNDENAQALNSAESYSLQTGRWRLLPTMKYPRVHASCCASNDFLFVFGGLSHNTIEKFDLVSETWHLVEMNLPIILHNLSVIIVQSQTILVLGGNDESGKPTQQVYIYDLTRESTLIQPQLLDAFASNKPPVHTHEVIYLFNDLEFTMYHPSKIKRKDSTNELNSTPSKIEYTRDDDEMYKSFDQGVFRLRHHSAVKYNVALPSEPSVLVVKRIGKDPEIIEAFRSTVEYLLTMCSAVFVEPGMASLVPPEVKRFTENHTSKINLVVTLGGDGTVIWATSLFKHTSMPPILAFNMGSLGFMTPYRFSDFNQTFSRVFSSTSVPVELMSRINTQILENDQIHNWGQASNEICIDRGPNTAILQLDIFLDGEFCTRATGDGILVATPCGSTAYSLSAGGSIVHPNVPTILLTPICPHSLSFRPILIPDSVTLSIKISETSRNHAWIGIDGHSRFKFIKGQILEISVSNYPVPRKC